MSDEIKINPVLPMALHPDNIPAEHVEALSVDGTLGKSVLGEVRAAYAGIYQALDDIHSTAKVVHEAERERNKSAFQMYERTQVLQSGMYFDPKTNALSIHLPAETAQTLNTTIGDHFTRATPALDTALKDIVTAKAKCEDQMAMSLRDASGGTAEAREVREYVRSLPAAEKAAFIRESVKNKDMAVVSAVLNVKHYVGGLPADVHATLRAEAMEVLAPIPAKQARALAWLEQNTLTGGHDAVSLLNKTIVKIAPAAGASLQALNKMRKGAAK